MREQHQSYLNDFKKKVEEKDKKIDELEQQIDYLKKATGSSS